MKNFYEQFKMPIVVTVLLFLGLFIYTKLAGPIPFFINSVQTTKTDLFSASGQGDATAVPDTATLSVGATQTSSNVTDAKNKVNITINKLLADLKSLGVSETDIKTTDYSVSPNYGTGEIVPMIFPSRGGNNITGYTVTQNVEIKIKQTDKTNNVIDLVTKDGANLVGGVNFTFSDALEKSLEEKARTQAVSQAKQKAQSLANAAGIHLGRVVNVVENSNTPRVFQMMAASKEATPTDNTQTTVTAGQNTITVNVVIYYETY